MHIFKKALLPLMATAAIVGCSNDNTDLTETDAFQNISADSGSADSGSARAVAVFQPSQANLPFPIDLLFSGTPDNSINIPGTAVTGSVDAPTAAQLADPQVALSTLDGFSTSAAIVFSVSSPVDPETLPAGVHMFTPDAAVDNLAAGIVDGVLLSSKTIVQVGAKLTYGLDYVASASADGLTIAILPLRPLAPRTTHYVAITSDLKTTSGEAVGADSEYQVAESGAALVSQSDGSACDFTDLSTCTEIAFEGLVESGLATAISFEQVRQQTRAHETVAAAFPGAPSAADIILGFSFSTQDVGTCLLYTSPSPRDRG